MRSRFAMGADDDSPAQGSTKPEVDSHTDGAGLAPPPVVLALVVLWAADEPERTGEILILPPGDPGPPRIFGRGAASAEDSERRLLLARHRPGSVVLSPPILSPSISRVQLHLRTTGAGTIEVKNLGQCRLSRNGDEIKHGQLEPGDTLELGKQMMFLCVRRPAWIAGKPPTRELAFGDADEHGIIGEAPAIWQLRERITFIGPRPGHVFIHGDSGTGKELVARALHASSPRAGRPLIARNAATIPEGLIDAELFGHARNYPNAGTPERPGLIGEADGGTLFLDEFAELPASQQAHLLRVLDSGEYHRLGEARARRSDFRLIAATNRPESALKHDVLARLPFRIETPGLNERREDIPMLVTRLLRRIARGDAEIARRFFEGGDGEAAPRLAPSLVRALALHTYTTHVRELETLLWRSLAGSDGKRLELCAEMGLGKPLPDALRPEMAPTIASNRGVELQGVAMNSADTPLRRSAQGERAPQKIDSVEEWEGRRKEIERERIIEALEKCGYNQTKAAQLLGIARRTMTYKMNELRIDGPRARRGGTEGTGTPDGEPPG